ncbi:MAG: DUF1552 domain-containing protein [Myxococcales bacterium]|nr:DUF1552 domain-containing protein [Myxococcales bacterium]
MGLTRRSFVGSLGAALVGSRLFNTRRAWAQSATARRLIVFFSPDGFRNGAVYPSGANLQFAAGSTLEPLAPVQQHLTLLGGLEYTNAIAHDRGMAHMLTNSPVDLPAQTQTAGYSLDQYVAARVGEATRYASLELGVQSSLLGAMIQTRMSMRGARQWVPPNDDPRDVYRRMFADITPDAVRLLERRRSVLDLVRAEVQDLSKRLSTEENAKLSAHLESLRTMERSFTPQSEAERCNAAPTQLPTDPLLNDNFPAVGRAQMDLMVAALACDLTRVASIQWSYAQSETLFTWLGHAETHHSLSHMDTNIPWGVTQNIEAGRWYAEQFRYLVERLAQLPDPSGPGTLLDNSVVLWMSEIGDGFTHLCTDVPIVVAGGGGGRLNPGRYLRYDGESHGKLLTSICHAMGVGVPSFGDESTGTGGLDGFLWGA